MRLFPAFWIATTLLTAYARPTDNRQWFLVDSYQSGGTHTTDTLHCLSRPPEAAFLAAFLLVWQGDTIAREWTCGNGLQVVSPLGALGMSNTFLLQICCGDGCPVMYKILSFGDDKRFFLSGMLGNCNELAALHLRWPYARLDFAGTRKPHRRRERHHYQIAAQHMGRTWAAKTPTRAYTIVPENGRFVAKNRAGEVLYEVFLYDNGPDYVAEGLFRMVREGKIGYADARTGQVVIEPRYPCAWPFEGGRARVSLQCATRREGEHSLWESEQWFYIDKQGRECSK